MRRLGEWARAGSASSWVAAAEAQDGGPRALLSVTEHPGGWAGRVEIDGLIQPLSVGGWSTREGAQQWCENTARHRFERADAGQVPGQLAMHVQENVQEGRP